MLKKDRELEMLLALDELITKDMENTICEMEELVGELKEEFFNSMMAF